MASMRNNGYVQMNILIPTDLKLALVARAATLSSVLKINSRFTYHDLLRMVVSEFVESTDSLNSLVKHPAVKRMQP
jgi:hypothetical protein